MIGKFQTFQNHLPNQLTQNQNIITMGIKGLESGLSVHVGTEGFRKCRLDYVQRSRVPSVGVGVCTRVEGFHKCRQKST